MNKRVYRSIMEQHNSYVLTIPMAFIKYHELKKGDNLKVEYDDEHPDKVIISIVD